MTISARILSFLQQFFQNARQTQAAACERGAFEVEYCQPLQSDPCPCCGGTTTTLNRFVKREGIPFAMCRITFAEGHLDEPARGILGIGEFGEGTDPHQRVAFGIALNPGGVMVIDATLPEWSDLEELGPQLTREQALKHPLKPELFRLVDQLYAEDKALSEFFRAVVARAETGASPNGGPATGCGDLGLSAGPPSVT